VLAIGAVGVGCVVFYAFLRYERLRADHTTESPGGPPNPAVSAPAAPQAPPRTVSVAPDQAETHTPLVILRVGQGDGARTVVALGRPEATPDLKSLQTRQPMLERELIRQAVLIAARDELGLSTRDELLDEAPPARAEGPPPPEIAVLFRPEGCRALVRRGAGEEVEVLVQRDLGARPYTLGYLPELTATAEELARSGFPALLKRLGLAGRPNRTRDDAPLPPGVEQRLEQLGLVDHFAAARALHEAIRADGESPARLAALARAYAQLGVLTEYQWSPVHYLFKARALLYAERLVVRHPRTPAKLHTRAFVRALVGRPDLALADIDAASRLALETNDATPAPSWLPLIDAYVKSDRKGLAIPDGPHAKLAALLNMMAVENPPGSRVHLLAARDLMGRDADCCRAFDDICEGGQLGERHVATVAGPAAFAKIFPEKLGALNALPAAVKQPLDQGRDEPAVVDALDQAGRPGEDAGEPSWGVLAHLAREARFMHAYRRLDFMANKWNVPAGEALAEFRPLVARHRFYPFLQSIASPRESAPALTEMADRLDLAEVELTEQPLIAALRHLKLPAGEQAIAAAMVHFSLVARDLAERLRHTNTRRDQLARALLDISPYSAFAMSVLIESDWDVVIGEVPGWREKVGGAPALLAALGRKYADLREFAEAENYLRRYIDLSPDPWAYRTLADCYKARGESERWQATLDEFLAKTEPAGLEHAKVQVDIANELMKRGRYVDAKKYAEPAAQTWAAWAMICASQCNEGLKDWDQAELWIRRTAERYPRSSAVEWYRFCKRSGHGDIQAARAFADAHKPGAADRPDPGAVQQDAFSLWMTGSTKQALDAMERADQARATPATAIAAFLLADELGDKARRDRLLEVICTRIHRPPVPRLIAIGRMMRAALAGDGKGSLDLPALDKVLDAMPRRTCGDADFLVGRFLLNRGQAESARKYLRRAAETSETQDGLKQIAVDSLRSIDAKKGR
jgi:tetratricopeptide (TPR) repeat protein